MAADQVIVTVLPGGEVDRRNAAAALGRTPKTLASWKSQGLGPRCFLVRGRCYYDWVEIQAFARGRRLNHPTTKDACSAGLGR
jgi:hypothetical protein